MANKTTKNTTPDTTTPDTMPTSPADPSLVEIDILRQTHKVDRATFAGVCAAQGWATGKAVTENEFLEAVAKFEASPMGGAKKEEKK